MKKFELAKTFYLVSAILLLSCAIEEIVLNGSYIDGPLVITYFIALPLAIIFLILAITLTVKSFKNKE